MRKKFNLKFLNASHSDISSIAALPQLGRSRDKRASMLYQVIMHLILIALIFAMFFIASVERVNSRAVKQQVLEKQTALLIDSAVPGMTFILERTSQNGVIDKLELRDGKVLVYVNGLTFSKGYPYFTRYDVRIEEQDDKFLIEIK